MMGYRTPNIDRIANEGALFTDMYAQQSCTAGRAAFILGQSPFRTGLLTIGVPGSPQGITKDMPTIAELLKPLGYTSGQFGKNHLGDRDEHLPTNHGFDEFFGNLYHLNAEEEPEGYYYPKNPEFRKKYGPRGVIHSWANKDGTQKIEDTGPLTTERMPTIDQEIYTAAMKFVDGAVEKKKPFFLWFNTTRMHVWTRLKKESEGKTGIGLYPDGMVGHDAMVGQVLKKIDDLGIADNTIVIYSTDNGAEKLAWPDGGSTPFFGEKGTTWEGFKCRPGQIYSGKVEAILQAVSTGQIRPSGLAITPDELQATPFVVRVKLDDEAFASSLPAGSVGTAAIYTDHVKPTHFIRKVLLRQIAILNYINPF
jgi:arylsulfatase A-like enzyme